jgi:hypothetical protein
MGCACTKRAEYQYVWTSEDGQETMSYPTEIQAKAKVIRAGGSYDRTVV